MPIYRSFNVSRILAHIGLCASIVVLPNVMTANELPVGPSAGDMDLSPFYRWQDEMPASPGAALRSETLQPQKEIPAASEAIRILYSSTDQRWQSGLVPVSGTLFLPAAPPPSEGWPLLAWAHGTLGIADICAPSWTGFKARDAAYINRWLERGFAVVASDYQGLGGPGPHPYSVWQAEGRSVLDAIRAAHAVRPGRLSRRTFLAGQSQGGGAALGAALLSATYAPDLTILGAIITAPNSTFPEGPVAVPPRYSNTMFLSFATGGLRGDGPAIEDILSSQGLELLDIARRGCTRDIALKARELKVRSFTDLLAITRDQLDALRVPTTDMPLAEIPFPLLIATGQADETITPKRQHAVAAALCAAGNQVTWRVFDGLGHDGVLHGSLNEAFAFADAQLAEQQYTPNCSNIQPPGPPGEKDPSAPFNDD
ncbi:alpha/beta hydrolase [Pseudomonas sp. KSR10]|uniref:lipase family protein n=1 Tax=Pseudomonas sp. KSR10 TaxID=2916654 RepID=UPI001EF8F1D8|nr:lipase family protein [Pseudomonas sp. KSR10]MCG6538546.1 alpha/beta hydrolase [Pseudomonas sp. KSR10]